MSDPHQSFFSRWSKFYESTPLLGPLLRAQQDAAIERLNVSPGERVLDLGCGPGRAMQALARAGAKVIGLDRSAEMLGGAGAFAPVVQASALSLPFAGASFDAILCTNSFHHYPEPLSTLREIRRVLRPGGRLALVDPNLDHPLARLVIYGGEALVFGMGVHLHSPREWREQLFDAGFNRSFVESLIPPWVRWALQLPTLQKQLERVPGIPVLMKLPDPLAVSLCVVAWA